MSGSMGLDGGIGWSDGGQWAAYFSYRWGIFIHGPARGGGQGKGYGGRRENFNYCDGKELRLGPSFSATVMAQ